MNNIVFKQLISNINTNTYKQGSKLPVLNGYITKVYAMKSRIFLDLSDGTTLDPIKIVIGRNLESQSNESFDVKKLKLGQSIQLTNAMLEFTPERKQPWEIRLGSLNNISHTSLSSNPYGIILQQRQSWNVDTTRNDYLLKYKRPYMSNILRFRSKLIKNIESTLDDLYFISVNPPLITTNDTEGNNETFKLVCNNQQNQTENSINKNINLTVSTQLHLEILSQSLSNVYSLSPCFRAERSDTSRHLSEFYMLELESTQYKDLSSLIKLSQSLIINTVKKFLVSKDTEFGNTNPHLLRTQNDYPMDALPGGLVIDRWEKLVDPKNWYEIDYVDAIKQLNSVKHLFNILPPTMDNWQDVNIASEHEKWISEKLFNGFVFIKNYPRNLKPFYMKWNDPQQITDVTDTVACFDLIFPQIGEIIGGSVRESDIDLIRKNKFASEGLDWYLDLREFGYRPTGGFGLGLERLLAYLLGLNNVKDTIPFYRTLKNKIYL